MTTYIRDIHLNLTMAEKVSNAQILKALEAQNASNAAIAEGMQTIIHFMGANQTAQTATVSAPQPQKTVPELLKAHGFSFTEVVGYRVDGKQWENLTKKFTITNPKVITELTEK